MENPFCGLFVEKLKVQIYGDGLMLIDASNGMKERTQVKEDSLLSKRVGPQKTGYQQWCSSSCICTDEICGPVGHN